jgi:hypothetical protein
MKDIITTKRKILSALLVVPIQMMGYLTAWANLGIHLLPRVNVLLPECRVKLLGNGRT